MIECSTLWPLVQTKTLKFYLIEGRKITIKKLNTVITNAIEASGKKKFFHIVEGNVNNTSNFKKKTFYF